MSEQLANNILNSINGQPALIAPSFVHKIANDLQAITTISKEATAEAIVEARHEMLSAFGMHEAPHDKAFAYADGIAFIPVTGTLINRYRWSWSGTTGYNYVREMLKLALRDDDVKGIVFDVNSGGGQVVGCFELAQEIYEARDIKPSMAMVDAFSFSAAYMLSSAASKIVITPTGEVGSIGALIAHFDYSKFMDSAGVKVSLIHSGDHKVDGNPYEKLSKDEIATMQAKVDTLRKEFVDAVAKHRALDTQAVFDTEAQTYSATEALALGLVDAIEAPQKAMLAFFDELSGSQSTQEIYMSTKTETPSAATGDAAQPSTQASAEAVTAEATAQAQAEAQAEARTAERQRINGILTSAEATNRSALANHIALNTQMSVEDAKALLAASPEVKAEATTPAAAEANVLDTAMAATGGGTGVQAEADTSGSAEQSRTQQILAAHALAVGA